MTETLNLSIYVNEICILFVILCTIDFVIGWMLHIWRTRWHNENQRLMDVHNNVVIIIDYKKKKKNIRNNTTDFFLLFILYSINLFLKETLHYTKPLQSNIYDRILRNKAEFKQNSNHHSSRSISHIIYTLPKSFLHFSIQWQTFNESHMHSNRKFWMGG